MTVTRISTAHEYMQSLRNRNLTVYLGGERVTDPVDHPVIRPSVRAVAATYELERQQPELASANSRLTGDRVNRFLHIAESARDLMLQNKMQRRLGQLTGTCFQRCVGMDAVNALYSVTYEIDRDHDSSYHERLLAFIAHVQRRNLVIGGAMTDVKGDRSLAPHQQPDMFVRVTARTDEGITISGAKAHQTGCINSHWLVVMPTMRLGENDRDFAVCGAIPVDAEGITYVYGRQSCDRRSAEAGTLDDGNHGYSGQEALIIFEDVFIPNHLVFMDGEVDYASMLVNRFTCYHRRSYVCKSGVGDVLIGAAAQAADDNGVSRASHIRDKLVQMTHLNETIYGTGIAASMQSEATDSGAVLPDEMLANVCKHHVTQIPYELGRLAQDLAGGLMVTMPSEADYRHPDLTQKLDHLLQARRDVPTESRLRILRLIENMTLGRNAVGYLTESMHGAGSPQAQRIMIQRGMQTEFKKRLARILAGVEERETLVDEMSEYFARVFDPDTSLD